MSNSLFINQPDKTNGLFQNGSNIVAGLIAQSRSNVPIM
jgi:hypothetical protein